MSDSVQWVLTSIIAIIAIIGGIIARDRQIISKVNDGDEKLHMRVNRVQDLYVKKEDLLADLKLIETLINQMAMQQMETNKRIDKVLTLMMNPKQ